MALLEEVVGGGGLLDGFGPLESQPSKLELRRFTALSFELLASKAADSCNASSAVTSLQLPQDKTYTEGAIQSLQCRLINGFSEYM